MSYELEGTLKEIFETKTFGKGFTKREFVVTTSKGPDDRWPQHVKMTVVKDKCTLLDRFQPGQRVKITFELRGNESNGRYFTDVQAWKIDAADGSSGGGGGNRASRQEAAEPDYADDDSFRGGPHDSMPF